MPDAIINLGTPISVEFASVPALLGQPSTNAERQRRMRDELARVIQAYEAADELQPRPPAPLGVTMEGRASAVEELQAQLAAKAVSGLQAQPVPAKNSPSQAVQRAVSDSKLAEAVRHVQERYRKTWR